MLGVHVPLGKYSIQSIIQDYNRIRFEYEYEYLVVACENRGRVLSELAVGTGRKGHSTGRGSEAVAMCVL